MSFEHGQIHYKIIISIFFLWLSSLPVANAEDGFVKDVPNGCSVFKPNLKTGETVVWQGECANGFAEGNGLAKWSAGDHSSVTFEGPFVHGKLQGEGKMIASGGDRYEGAYVDGKRDGNGIYNSANGDRFQGQYKANQRHGHGILTLASGQRIEGEWQSGVQTSTSPATENIAPVQPAENVQSQTNQPKIETPGEGKDQSPKSEPQSLPETATTQNPDPVISPQQLAQQELVKRQQEESIAQEALQARENQRRLEQQQQQKIEREMVQAKEIQRLAEGQTTLNLQRLIDRILFWLFISSPIFLALLVWKFEWKPGLSAADKIQSWIEPAALRASASSSSISKYVKRPFVWALDMAFGLSASVANPYLKAGTRLAAVLYLIGGFITLAIWITALVIAVVIMILIVMVGGPFIREVMRGLGLETGGSSGGMSSAFRKAASFASNARETRERKGLTGRYTETTDEHGNVIATEREREGLTGKYTEIRDAQGNIVGESRDRDGLFEKYRETSDTQGKVVAESREREGLLEKYIETTDAEGNVIAESRERDGLLGKYTEHKKP